MPGFNSIDGISSGLNTTEMVDAIMDFERRPAVLLEVQQAEKQAVVSAFQSLQAKFLALSSDLSNISNISTFEKASITVSDDSYLSATRGGDISSGTYSFQVLELAHNHQIASQGFDDDSLEDFGTGDITINVGDGAEKIITIDESNNSLVEIKDAINNANAGINASIINDGTSSNAFRLVLSANETGKQNQISITSQLSGGSNLNFGSSSFDNPETISEAANSTSAVSLGATSAYTGDTNTSFTFTVAGTGEQTIGTDTITLNWVDDNDATNNGSIIVTQADFEYEVVGADGMYLSFSSGVMTAGDSFKVDTFTPLLQSASNARVAIGSGDGTGAPITVSSDTNNFTEIVGGINLSVKKVTAPGESITVNTDIDVSGIKERLNSFIKNYNSLNEYIDKQNTYNVDTQEAPILFGDYTIWRVQNSLRSKVSSIVEGVEGQYNQLYSIGIKTDVKGQLKIDNNAKLEAALRDNLEDVIKLFTNTGNSSNNGIEFMSATEDTKAGDTYDVDITQAATHGGFQGESINDLATTAITIDDSNKNLKFKIDGTISEEIALVEGTYNSNQDLIDEIQAQIDADSKIGSRGVTVEWVDNGDGTGYINLETSSYGTYSKIELESSIENSAFSALGISGGTTIIGKDVAGTVNGEEMTGSAQILRGEEGSETTEGLVLKVTLDEANVDDAVEGTLAYTQGLGTSLKYSVDNITKANDGVIDNRINMYKNQIESISDQIKAIDERLALRRESLYKKFYEMEVALGEMNSQMDFLETQFAGINANWGTGQDN